MLSLSQHGAGFFSGRLLSANLQPRGQRLVKDASAFLRSAAPDPSPNVAPLAVLPVTAHVLGRCAGTGTYKGQTYVVPNLEFYECPNCGERLYDRDAMRKIEAHCPAYPKPRTAAAR